jgi:hypothetical protein
LEVHLASVSLEPMFDGAGQRRSPFALTGHADLHGTPRELEISGAFDTSLGPALVYAVARRRGDAIDVPSVQVRCGDSRLVGRGSAANGRLVADVDELVVAPSLLRALASDLDPEWPVHASATAAGPFRAIDIMVDARAGPTTISLAARVDALARSGRITGRIDTFDGGVLKRSSHEIRLTLEFVAGGRLDRGGIVGYLAIRDGLGVIDGTPLYRAGLGARLEGRSARLTVGRLYVQGAIVEGTAGSANLDGAIDLQYNVISTNPFKIRQLGRPLQVLVGVRQILPGRLAEGRVTRRPGGPFDVEGHVSVPGMDQIKAVAQSLSGGAPDY